MNAVELSISINKGLMITFLSAMGVLAIVGAFDIPYRIVKSKKLAGRLMVGLFCLTALGLLIFMGVAGQAGTRAKAELNKHFLNTVGSGEELIVSKDLLNFRLTKPEEVLYVSKLIGDPPETMGIRHSKPIGSVTIKVISRNDGFILSRNSKAVNLFWLKYRSSAYGELYVKEFKSPELEQWLQSKGL